MLTNNNKRSFVKLLALTMAALMVFSVCLTGCTDKDARAAAENAQATADAAATEAEVAAKITEALAPYLKTADAMTEDKVESIVAEAIKGCATSKDLEAFAKSSDLKDLSDKLSGYVTGADVEKTVKNAMASYDIDKKIADAIAKNKSLTADDVQKMINDSLKNYLTADEVDERVEAILAGYFGEYTAAEVQAMMTAMDKAMNTEDWNDATELVIKVLGDADDLLERCAAHTFTQASMKAINDYTGLQIFPEKDGVCQPYNADAANDQMAALGILILRAPNLADPEYGIQKIVDNISNALAVESLEDHLEGIRNRLYALGTVVTVDTDRDGAVDDGDKHPDSSLFYHDKGDQKKAVKSAQVVTAAQQADFTAIVEYIDELLIEYAVGSTKFAADYGLNKDNVYSVYTWTKGDQSGTEIVKAGTYKGDSAYGITFSTDSSADLNKDDKARTFVRHTIGLDTKVDAAPVTNLFKYDAPASGMYMTGYFNGKYNEPGIRVDLCDYTVDETKPLAKLLNKVTPEPSKALATLAETYAAIETMLDDCKVANDKANALFETFLRRIGVNNDTNKTLLADAEYVTKLKDYMAEQTTSDKKVTVPNDIANVSWETTGPWLAPNGAYTVEAGITPWASTNAQANTVAVYVDYAKDINGQSAAGITKHPLYEDLTAEAYDELFDKYQMKALEVLSIMQNDYTIAVQAAGMYGTDIEQYITFNGKAAEALKLENTADVKTWTDGFIKAFFEGTKYTWSIGPEHSFKGMKQYYKNNGIAKVPGIDGDKLINTAVYSDVLAVMAANAKLIQIELAAATVQPRMDILQMTAESGKAANLSVQEVFNTALSDAKANLDEIIYRWTYAEIKDAILNDAYAAVLGVDGVAVAPKNNMALYYNDKKGASAEIEDVLKKYVTGFNDATAAQVDGSDANDYFDSYAFEYKKNATSASAFYYTLASKGEFGVVATNLDNIILTDADKAITAEFTFAGTNAVTSAEQVYTDAITMMQNKAIEVRFNDYLAEAKSTLYFSWMSYNRVATDYATLNKLYQTYNLQLENIAIIEYMRNRGDIPADGYLNAFTTILTTVIKYDSTYYDLLGYDTAEKVTNFKKQVKSYDKTNAAANTEGWFNVVKPEAIVSNVDDYFAFGAAVVNFDSDVNKDAVKKKADGTLIEKLYQ